MTDPNDRKDKPENPAQDSANGSTKDSVKDKEPVVSKPYIMPDDPEEIADPSEVLVKEAAEARDKMLRTLAEMENLRKRTQREVADARTYGIAAFARDVL